ncbi:hypothetical protein [Limimaricola pyoseonensis]|uniref:Uncharacterized protein n=1 Tax=Limimaricola pyoseonensis TaxID=521013 RepID=A0A1G7D5K0_9RHOB|nr:hypothetical protein [Limimaricola pyoseonensis]SDE46914.1 hypothetical protein SAMN04488567_1800 [Limimaricola pyoseonensis]
MSKRNDPIETIRKLAERGRSILAGLADAVLPQPQPDYRPIPIPADDRRRR